MGPQQKTPRKRVTNFTAHEKVLLAHLVKMRPIIVSKLSDGKTLAKKQAAWDLITQEFNCNSNVQKRETITLKRAWDNLKAFTRKVRATSKGGHCTETGGALQGYLPPPQHAAIISIVEEAAAVKKCEMDNEYDSDGTTLEPIKLHNQDLGFETDNESQNINSASDETLGELDLEMNFEPQTTIIEENEELKSPQIEEYPTNKHSALMKNSNTEGTRKSTDYTRREGVLRLRHLENEKRIAMQILNIQLETEQIRKNSALLEEERNKVLLEKAKIELEELKKRI